MHNKKFDRSEHVYRNDSFLELIKDAVRFFSGTPVHSLPPPERFQGAGVYALYYTGHYSLYDEYSRINRLAYNLPIYVGRLFLLVGVSLELVIMKLGLVLNYLIELENIAEI